jgi:hypothetical protein
LTQRRFVARRAAFFYRRFYERLSARFFSASAAFVLTLAVLPARRRFWFRSASRRKKSRFSQAAFLVDRVDVISFS